MKQPWDVIRGTHVKQDKYRRKKANPPHLWECCGVTPAPGCGRRCREPGARCRGPCTRWSLFLGGCSVAGLWELWQLRRDQSRTWAGPSHPAVLQSQTEYNTTRKQHYQPVWRKQQQQKQHGNSQKLHKANRNERGKPCAVACGCCWASCVNAIRKLGGYKKLGSRIHDAHIKCESRGQRKGGMLFFSRISLFYQTCSTAAGSKTWHAANSMGTLYHPGFQWSRLLFHLS